VSEQIISLGRGFYRVLRSQTHWPQDVDLTGISAVAWFGGQLIALLRRTPELIVLSSHGEVRNRIALRGVILGHGLRALGPDLLAVTDVDGHQVLLLDADFKEVQRLTCGNRPALGRPFNHPTDCARDSQGWLYVADGYGNSQVHVFTPDYLYSHSFGGAGTGIGQFSTPHNIAMLQGDSIAVADRENNRVQILMPDGGVVAQIDGLHKPMGLAVLGDLLLVTDQTPRLSAYDATGALIGRCRTFATYGHGICVAPDGDIFIADMIPDGITRLSPLEIN
jgi:hypothetical protein